MTRTLFRPAAAAVCALLLASGSYATAQPNAAPTVTDVRIEHRVGEVQISFLCSDPDDDSVVVSLSASIESDPTHIWTDVPSWRFIRLPGNQSGDVGLVPTGQRIVRWTFNEADPAVGRIMGAKLRIRVTADDRHPVDIGALLPRVDSAQLKSDLRSIDGPRNSSDGLTRRAAARQRILRLFDTLGFRSSQQAVASGSGTGYNLIGDQQGASSADTTIVICGHYDTVPTAPGADDNGSGTVGMMSTARAFSGMHFRHTVRYIGFDMEELGLLGSMQYTSAIRTLREKVKAALNQDMIGYARYERNTHTVSQSFRDRFPEASAWIDQHEGRGDFVMLFTDGPSIPVADLWQSIGARYVPELPSLQVQYENAVSDHAAFWSSGYHSIMMFDGAGWRTPYYHTPGDSIGTLDFGFMTNIARVTMLTAATLAEPLHAGASESAPFMFGVAAADRESAPVAAEIFVAPNPASSVVIARIAIPRAGHITATLHDMRGRTLATLLDERREAGQDILRVDTRALGLEPGVYVVRLATGTSVVTAMVVVVDAG